MDSIPPQPENAWRAFLTLREPPSDQVIDHLAVSDFQPPLSDKRINLLVTGMARYLLTSLQYKGELTEEVTLPSMEQLHDDWSADLYAALEEHAPKPYTVADIRRNEYDEDRMRGYNDAIEEFWTAIGEVFGKPEPDEKESP